MASGSSFPDALAASYLASAVDGPILLTGRDELPSATSAELQALQVSHVYVVGGPNVVSDGVTAALGQLMVAAGRPTVTRLGGANRYDTDLQIASFADPSSIGTIDGQRTALVVSGVNFPDALAASPIAFANRLPILLTDPAALPAQASTTLLKLGIGHVVIVGGPSAASAGVQTALADGGLTVERVAGDERTATAAALASWAQSHADFTHSRIALARGDDAGGGIDALALAVMAGARHEPLLLTSSPDDLGAGTAGWLSSSGATLDGADIAGGIGAISQPVANQLQALVETASGGGDAGGTGGGGGGAGGTGGGGGGGGAPHGTVWAWGANGGELGTGSLSPSQSSVPVRVLNLDDVVALSGSFALKSDGTAWTWGGNGDGELGNGTDGYQGFQYSVVAAPVQVHNLTGMTAIAAGGATRYALKSDGAVWAWGSNSADALGVGVEAATLPRVDLPTQVVGLPQITAIAAGQHAGYALAADGSVWAWGINESGELGNGTDGTADPSAATRSTPGRVVGLNGIVALAAGAATAYALASDGTVWTWGDTVSGVQHTPVKVLNLSDVTAISAGGGGGAIYPTYGTGYALRSDGTVWAWGANNNDLLGDGTAWSATVADEYSSDPVQVVGLSNVVAVAGGASDSYALSADGTIWSWGSALYGALGTGTVTTDTAVAVHLPAPTDVAIISAGSSNAFAATR